MATPLSKPAPEITTQVTLPDNSGYTWLYDSTDPRNFSGVALGKTTGVRPVGPLRGLAKNLRMNLGARCTTQNVTIKIYTLDGAGVWNLYATSPGEVALTAGASPQLFEWSSYASDVLVGFLAGVTAPSAIATTLYFVER
jgi:hypothetical protein